MTGGLSIWGLFYHRFWNRLGTFRIPSKGVKMHACSWSIWYTEEVRNGLLRPLRFRKPESYPIFYIDIDMYIFFPTSMKRTASIAVLQTHRSMGHTGQKRERERENTDMLP